MKNIIFFLLIISISLSAQTKIQQGQLLIDQEKYEEAKDYYEDLLETEPSNDSIYYQLGYVWVYLDDFDEATEYAEKAVEMKPNNADYHHRLGSIYGRDARNASIFRQPGLVSSFKEEMLKTLELKSDHLGAHVALAQFYRMAPGIVGGDTDKAIEHAKIVKGMDDKQGAWLLARTYQGEEMYDKAESEFKFLVDKYGDDKEFHYLYNNYGYLLLEQKKYDEALTMFKKQVELAPDKANPYDSLGEVYRLKGMLKEALANYKKVLEIYPESESAQDAVEEITEELEN